jgi:hypothetical protein
MLDEQGELWELTDEGNLKFVMEEEESERESNVN